MRHVSALASAVLMIVLGVAPGHADKRVALVIGNGAYRNTPALINPKNDADDVSRSLQSLGFETIAAVDLDRTGMNEVLDRFSRLVGGADIALVYYSGHGMQFAGKNYLLPVDARLASADDVNKFRLMPLDDVVDVLQGARGARVVILDACRNNPVEEDLKRRLASLPGANRDAFLSRGLGRISAGNGLIVAYATQASDVAADGSGRNSPFTSAFLHNVGTPDIDVRQMFFRIQDEVDQTTGGRQRPELSISLVGEFKLKVAIASADKPQIPGPAPSGGAPASAPTEVERAWAAVKDTTSVAVLEAFVRRFGDGFYGDIARARLEELRTHQMAALPPPAAAAPAPPSSASVAPTPSSAPVATFPGVREISGAGATFPYPVYAKWAEAYKREAGVGLNYQAIDSGGGIKQIEARTVTFGATDVALSADELSKNGLIQFPTVLGAVVPVVHVEGLKSGELVIDGPTLAKIFLGEVKTWDDPAIRRLNPNARLPSSGIAVVHRSDGSGMTFTFTSYLSKVSSDWKSKVGASLQVEWPAGIGAKGNEGVASSVLQTRGSIGYLEYAYAKQQNLAVVKMVNRDGKAVAATPEAFQAAAVAIDWASAGEPLTDAAGPGAWPITSATFILIHRQPQDPAAASTALKFFTWAFAQGDRLASDLDYVPLPASVKALVQKTWVDQIRTADGKALFRM
jgi:phosphate transport system substrate-binding protein